jgi:hypothetical protein
VASIEERVAFVEGRLVEHSEMFSDLRAGLSSLGQRIDHLEQRMDRRFAQMDARFAQIDARFLQVEARLDRLGGDLSKNFRWIVGIQITTLLTVVATLLGALAMR